MGKGSGSATKSPYRGLARRIKPRNPREVAVSRIAVIVDVPLKNPCENKHRTILPATMVDFNSPGFWHSSAFVVEADAASVAATSVNRKIPSPGVGAAIKYFLVVLLLCLC
jgi:hypothetical protein